MIFSLITSTIGRTFELEKLIESLTVQTFSDFELIIIDQNDDNRLKPIIEKYASKLDIKHLRSEKGLSKGRNAGLDRAGGDIICFPDDDCEFPAGLLENIGMVFQNNGDLSFVSTKVVDKTTGKGIGIRWKNKSESIGSWNLFDTFSSASIFIKRQAIGSIRFDEKLGAGARFGSSEETDFVYRIILKNERGCYEPSLFVFHPDYPEADYNLLKKRTYNYALGFGAFFKKQLSCNFSMLMVYYFMKYLIAGSIIGILLRLADMKKLKLKAEAVRGMWDGFLQYGK